MKYFKRITGRIIMPSDVTLFECLRSPLFVTFIDNSPTSVSLRTLNFSSKHLIRVISVHPRGKKGA